MIQLLYSISLLVFVCSTAIVSRACPPLGPVFPALRHPFHNDLIQSAAASLNESFKHQFDSDIVYRVGSITKVFTVLALLLQHEKINWQDPVTDYVPELLQLVTSPEDKSTDITAVRWTEVTIEALASQLAGIPREFSDDLAILSNAAGLPPLSDSERPECGIIPPCTPKDFFRDFGRRHAIYTPYTSPVYSNVAFAILGFVVEAVTNKTFNEYLREAVLDPLHLTRTSLMKPANDKWGAIPWNSFSWVLDTGFENPDGSMYSSTKDLLAFGRSILEHRLLQPFQTRAWLKPRSHTATIDQLVGSPWEIFRGKNVTHDGRIIDFYTKGGTSNEYHSLLVLVPEYGLVLTVLTAGIEASGPMVAGLATQITETILPAIEKATKLQTLHDYEGSYQSATTTTSGTSSMDLSIDTGPGLLVTKLTCNGTDMIHTWASIRSFPHPPRNFSLRLFPTGLVAENGASISWRGVLHFAPTEDSPRLLFYPRDECITWFRMDREVYGRNAFDDFVFTLDGSGVAVGVELRGLRLKMVRVRGESMTVQ